MNPIIVAFTSYGDFDVAQDNVLVLRYHSPEKFVEDFRAALEAHRAKYLDQQRTWDEWKKGRKSIYAEDRPPLPNDTFRFAKLGWRLTTFIEDGEPIETAEVRLPESYTVDAWLEKTEKKTKEDYNFMDED